MYAEDPFKNFGMPSIGRLYRYQEPIGFAGVRCDSGIEEGSEISMFYDAMICKLSTYGDTRQEAIERSVDALDHYVIRGVTHNIALLRDVLLEGNFRDGNFTTNYLPETYPDGFLGKQPDAAERSWLASVVAVMTAKLSLRSQVLLNDKYSRDTRKLPAEWDLVAYVKDEPVPVVVKKVDGGFAVKVGDGQEIK